LGICTLTGKDILLLRPTLDEGAPATSLWLDDAVIDYFLAEYDLRDKKLVAGNSKKTPRMPTKFFSCHFIDRIVSGDSNVKRWSKGQTLSNFDKLILPVNIGNYHWALLVVRMAAKTVSYYDSGGGDGSRYFPSIIEYLGNESKGYPDLGKEPWAFKAADWKFVNAKTPRQTNGYDCGVFVIQIADLVSLDIPLLFGQRDIDVVRRRLLVAIFERLNDPSYGSCTVVGDDNYESDSERTL
jgi:sentrin-specific protease 1